MEIFRGLESYPPDRPPSVVALGTFDGIHLAHQKILTTATERARALGLCAVVCTFEPHPLQVLQPDRAPTPIMDLADKLELMSRHGLDAAVVVPFTHEFSRIEAEDFVAEVLAGILRAREVVVGFNHTFGRGARGTPALLQEWGARAGYAVHVVPPLSVDGFVVSSSAIREALQAGDVRKAESLLGRPYSVRGRVLRGTRRGHLLGFPTANLKPDRELILAPGVYAARASWKVGDAGAVINLGLRPTFGEGEYWLEAHLLDFSGDLYEQTLTLAFVTQLRAERKFENIQALQAQVARDIALARRLLHPSASHS